MRYIKEFFRFLKHIYSSRELLLTLIKNDFRKQYLGSYLGLLWAFIQPLTFIVVIWFVFEIGFRAGPTTDGTPFFLYLTTGMIPWFFISSAFTSGTNSIVANSFLVKKVSFRVSILPLVQIGSALIIHLALVGFLIGAFLLYGYMPTIYWLQLPFYMLCSIVLLLGLSWLTSAIRVFVKDVGNFIGVLMQIGFWATPIFWSIDMIPASYQWILKLNPAFYIVDGYRNTFIYGSWFWEHQNITLYYSGLTLFCLVFGAIVFKRLRPHFGDVL
ncbi:ABC transporter permease [Aliarcobacter skirrowii]|uniref:ABC transporter permease n=1 Tax=Aliarcobacter skirrowii TaxID=28200 RepID=UPI0029AD0EF4|nr:ABC transporter permease [Aliarcobacter skirrowii]MDX4026631.1 ABC transporter permease [Aliarcobacter skirrowii]